MLAGGWWDHHPLEVLQSSEDVALRGCGDGHGGVSWIWGPERSFPT